MPGGKSKRSDDPWWILFSEHKSSLQRVEERHKRELNWRLQDKCGLFAYGFASGAAFGFAVALIALAWVMGA